MTDENEKAIIPRSKQEDRTWSTIVEEIAQELNQADLPEQVIRATELLLCGYSISETANEIGIAAPTIRRWLTRYPKMALTLADNRTNLIKWRMAQLEKQFLTAIERSQEILSANYTRSSAVNPKILAVVAQQARYIIGLFAGQKIDVHVVHDVGGLTLRATQDAMDYLADRLAAQRDNQDLEPIETTVRVIDPHYTSGPILDSNGKAFYGELGVLDWLEGSGYLCHVCGERLKQLAGHVYNRHNLSPREYETIYMLPPGCLRASTTKTIEDETNE